MQLKFLSLPLSLSFWSLKKSCICHTFIVRVKILIPLVIYLINFNFFIPFREMSLTPVAIAVGWISRTFFFFSPMWSEISTHENQRELFNFCCLNFCACTVRLLLGGVLKVGSCFTDTTEPLWIVACLHRSCSSHAMFGNTGIKCSWKHSSSTLTHRPPYCELQNVLGGIPGYHGFGASNQSLHSVPRSHGVDNPQLL